MPDVSDSIQQLKSKFLDRGLSEKDLVLLSGISSLSHPLSFIFCDLSVGGNLRDMNKVINNTWPTLEKKNLKLDHFIWKLAAQREPLTWTAEPW